MNTEIERKFLVKSPEWKQHIKRSYSIKQGYFDTKDGSAIRVRISDNGSYVTIKLPKINDNECPEFEYHIPLEDAEYLINWCKPAVVEKTRHEVEWQGLLWEVDVFEGKLSGIIVAEIELDSMSDEIELPKWVAREVTEDVRYTNEYLASRFANFS